MFGRVINRNIPWSCI